MKKMIVWIMTLFVLAGCGVSSPYMTKLEVARAVVANPSAATVVFVRPSGYGGRQKVVILDERGRFLGECWGKTHFAVAVPPGEHTFIAWSEGTPALHATLEPGKIYYVEVGFVIGFWSGRARLFAVGPQRQQWRDIVHWIEDTEMLVPNEPAGQAYVDERGDKEDVVQKGLANYAGYEGEERERRTLLPSDGVTQLR